MERISLLFLNGARSARNVTALHCSTISTYEASALIDDCPGCLVDNEPPRDSGLVGRMRENFVVSEMQGREQVHWHALMEEATISDDQEATKDKK